ncbi:hypothetical protein MWU54_08570 [Marivita sp. S6314]|uniref:hypothetical protein n=1 Tax=Marivita sp. S6314 TaxID=2926406 RepID=UPI001FF24A64|nr:hypothetical protein [Marivita sp. S6314]MCK0150071.1 hypothetical protein [Marivita sp. S6314]
MTAIEFLRPDDGLTVHGGPRYGQLSRRLEERSRFGICHRSRHRRLRVTVRKTFQGLVRDIRAVQRSSALNIDGLAMYGGQAVTRAVNTLREVDARTLNKLTDTV